MQGSYVAIELWGFVDYWPVSRGWLLMILGGVGRDIIPLL